MVVVIVRIRRGCGRGRDYGFGFGRRSFFRVRFGVCMFRVFAVLFRVVGIVVVVFSRIFIILRVSTGFGCSSVFR